MRMLKIYYLVLEMMRKKHNEILRFIYSNISSEVIENPTEKVIESKETKYYEDLETALLKDVALVKKYRKIMGAMPTSRMHTLVMSNIN